MGMDLGVSDATRSPGYHLFCLIFLIALTLFLLGGALLCLAIHKPLGAGVCFLYGLVMGYGAFKHSAKIPATD